VNIDCSQPKPDSTQFHKQCNIVVPSSYCSDYVSKPGNPGLD